jgi:hypothetical protein
MGGRQPWEEIKINKINKIKQEEKQIFFLTIKCRKQKQSRANSLETNTRTPASKDKLIKNNRFRDTCMHDVSTTL